MSVRSNIRYEDGWYQGEDKTFTFACLNAAGTPQNLTGYNLLFILSTAPNGTVIFRKSGASITLVNVAGTLDGARVTIADTDTITDPAGAIVVAAGLYYHELWKTNEGDEQLLSYGDAILSPSRRRQETS